MTTTVFQDYNPATPIVAAWLNDVNTGTYVTQPAQAAEISTLNAEVLALQSQVSGQIIQVGASLVSSALQMTLNPVSLTFRSPTASMGTTESIVIPSTLTLSAPAGATFGMLNGVQAILVLLVAYNSGSPVLCVSNMAGGLDLGETGLISPTIISAGATASNVIYSAAAVTANAPYRVVGYIQITEATAGTWASAPTLVQGAGGQAFASLQSVGFGQTWQNVTGSRTAGVVYYNTTSRPIMVKAVAAVGASNQNAITMTVNGVLIDIGGGASTGFTNLSVSGIVPPGVSYMIALAATEGLSNWAELR